MTDERIELMATAWQQIETAPKDTAVLTYGFGYEVAHFNTRLGQWLTSSHERLLGEPLWWQPLPEQPPGSTASLA